MKNKKGGIDYTEFLMAGVNRTQLLTNEKLTKVFNYFDINHSGKVNIDEIKKGDFSQLSKEEKYRDPKNTAFILPKQICNRRTNHRERLSRVFNERKDKQQRRTNK